MNEKTEGTFKIPKKKEPVIKTDEQKRAAIKEPLIKLNDEIPKVIIDTKPKADALPEQITDDVDADKQTEVIQEVEESISTAELTEVTVKKETEEQEVTITEPEPIASTQRELPENIEKLVSFMEETGGNIQDYMRLNTNYDDVDKNVLVKEYYKASKPHLSAEEIDFVIEDNFSFDEEIDEERDIRKKKIAYKEEIAKARTFLNETKDKYYDDIKLRSSTASPDQTEANDFFNRFKKREATVSKNQEAFKADTKKLFNEDFKGFDFNVGDKTFRMSVPNADKVSEKQQDIGNFVSKYTGESGTVVDTVGYHKALYAASNPDKMANHFYEQGKADAIREITNKSNNVSTESRQAQPLGEAMMGKWKVKGVSGGQASKLKMKKFN